MIQTYEPGRFMRIGGTTYDHDLKIIDKGIQIVIRETPQAVEAFNRLLKEGRKVAGAFHLTC